MPEFEDCYLATPVINKIDDSVIPLSHSVTVDVPGELFGPLGPRGRGQGLQSLNDALTVCLGAYCLKFLRSRRLDQHGEADLVGGRDLNRWLTIAARLYSLCRFIGHTLPQA